MALIVGGSFLLGCLSIVQALHILRTGDPYPFFLGTPSSRRLANVVKLRLATTYMLPGGGIIGLLLTAYAKADKRVLNHWVATNLHALTFALVLLVGGFAFIYRPGIVIKTARSAYPDLSETQPSAVLSARLVGAGFTAMGLFVLAMLKR